MLWCDVIISRYLCRIKSVLYIFFRIKIRIWAIIFFVRCDYYYYFFLWGDGIPLLFFSKIKLSFIVRSNNLFCFTCLGLIFSPCVWRLCLTWLSLSFFYFVCLSVCVSVCHSRSVYLSISLLSICLSVSLSLSLSLSLSPVWRAGVLLLSCHFSSLHICFFFLPSFKSFSVFLFIFRFFYFSLFLDFIYIFFSFWISLSIYFFILSKPNATSSTPCTFFFVVFSFFFC